MNVPPGAQKREAPAALATRGPHRRANPKVRDSSFDSPMVTLFKLGEIAGQTSPYGAHFVKIILLDSDTPGPASRAT
jgi:hypothetical protein